ncbi:MAG: alpha/beta hydrolase [Desulfobulbaceae bacterium]|nr:alpha/beta hydrolase [Desulfobulbaceae bacterium]
MATRSKQIILSNCVVHYLESGTSDKPPVVFLHGMKFQAATWEQLGTLTKVAEAGFRAIALDMPGFGSSPSCDLPAGSVLVEFFQKIGLQSPILVGPSMGGRISLEFALDHPSLLGGLVLVGSVGVAENHERLPRLKIPLLIVWGGKDQIAPPAHADLLHKAVAGSTKVVIDSAPHPCYLEEPEKWHDTLINFLATY